MARQAAGIESPSDDRRHKRAAGLRAAVGLSAHLEEAINTERRNLQKAESVLGCLVVALEYGYDGDDSGEPDYSDVARAVRDILAASITQLDPTSLRRTIASTRRSNG